MRCAIYTRVSTDEQARSDYSSLDRQRELCASYVDLHREDHWKVTEVYEDGGYSGKDMNRPALQRLLRDFTNGKVDAVVTYKIDRVSRSLKDFYDFWELLQEHKVTFASATQQFDTSTSAGMLMLNILLSFAQYERELTRERTLSKMAGRAERGLWNGGMVPIGFDYCAEAKALTANEREAEIVQFAFERFIETKSPSLVANEANSRGYRTKKRQVVARDGATKEIGGNRFDEDTVKAIIRNPLYKGVIRYDGKLFPGTHSPIVAPETWDRANQYVGQAREDDGTRNRDEHVHLLKGIAKCGVCGTTMTPYPAGKKGKDGQPYLYYACTSVTQDGSASPCPVRSLPAREFETLIKSVLIDLGAHSAMLESCVQAANREAVIPIKELEEQQRRHREEVARLTTGIRRIIEIIKSQDDLGPDLRAELKKLSEEKEQLGTLIEKLQMDIDHRRRRVLDAGLIRRNLVEFERLVNLMPAADQKELMQLLLNKVEVRPFDPERDGLPDGSSGAFATKVRSKWYRVSVSLQQLPGLGLGKRHSGGSSDYRGKWLPDLDSNQEHRG